MMNEVAVVRDWRTRLKNGQTGVVLADAHHPLEIYVGANDSADPLVQIRSSIKPQLPELSSYVLVSRTEDASHWVLTMSLQDRRFTEVFLHLVGHIVSASRVDPTSQAAWTTVNSLLNEWKGLFRARPTGLLSLEELRGLVGEMWLMLNRFVPSLGIESAINGWLGPLNAPQDFWYPESGFHEVKAIGPSRTSIKISSEYQLDESPMELLVLQMPQVLESDLGAINLAQLVAHARSALAEVGLREGDLRLRLNQMGVDENERHYSETWFRVTTVESFRVDELFPAVRRSLVQSGVQRVRYSLERSAIAPFLVSTERY